MAYCARLSISLVYSHPARIFKFEHDMQHEMPALRALHDVNYDHHTCSATLLRLLTFISLSKWLSLLGQAKVLAELCSILVVD